MNRRIAGIGAVVSALIGLAVSTQLRAQEKIEKMGKMEKQAKHQTAMPSRQGLPLSSHLDQQLVQVQQEVAAAHCTWLAERIKEVKAVKIGMRRRDIDKLMAEDVGGERFRNYARYMNLNCEYIKLDVRYNLNKGTKTSDGRDNDTVSKISAPLLDLVPNRARL